jgi:hypothetical protein
MKSYVWSLLAILERKKKFKKDCKQKNNIKVQKIINLGIT